MINYVHKELALTADPVNEFIKLVTVLAWLPAT
jgi:hypothetical protein